MPKKKSLEEQYWTIMAENHNRHMKQLRESESEPGAKIPKGPVKFRSSFAFAKHNPRISTDKVIPMDVSGPVSFLPGGSSGLYEILPQLRLKNAVEYWVIQKRGKRELMIGRGFTKCCPPDKACKTQRCAKCWAFSLRKKKGWRYIVREVICGNPKVVDPFGVDPHGKRSQTKDLASDTRALFKLTSSQFHYKYGAANWK